MSGWDTGNVTTMSRMFFNSVSANVNFSGLDLGNVTNVFQIFFNNVSMSNDNYGNYLVELANDLPPVGNKQAYCNQCAFPAFSVPARATLTADGWTFVDQGAE